MIFYAIQELFKKIQDFSLYSLSVKETVNIVSLKHCKHISTTSKLYILIKHDFCFKITYYEFSGDEHRVRLFEDRKPGSSDNINAVFINVSLHFTVYITKTTRAYLPKND